MPLGSWRFHQKQRARPTNSPAHRARHGSGNSADLQMNRRPSSTIDHRDRRWDRAEKNRAAPSAIFFQKTESDFAARGRQRAFPLGRTMRDRETGVMTAV